jgi:hypothetical protein
MAGPQSAFQPLLSVVVLCFNQAHTVAEAIQSAIGPTDSRVEVIVVDDASTDTSVSVVQSLAQTHPRIRHIIHKQNQGTWLACASGFSSSQGRFVTFLAGDDRLLGPGLANAVDALEEMSDGPAALHYGLEVGGVTGSSRVAVPWTGVSWLDSCLIGFQPLGPSGGLIFAKSPDVNWSLFWDPPTRNLQEDWLLHFRLATTGFRVKPVEQVLYFHTLRAPGDVQGLDADDVRLHYRGLNRGLMWKSAPTRLVQLAVLSGIRLDRRAWRGSIGSSWSDGFRASEASIPNSRALDLLLASMRLLWPTLRILATRHPGIGGSLPPQAPPVAGVTGFLRRRGSSARPFLGRQAR